MVDYLRASEQVAANLLRAVIEALANLNLVAFGSQACRRQHARGQLVLGHRPSVRTADDDQGTVPVANGLRLVGGLSGSPSGTGQTWGTKPDGWVQPVPGQPGRDDAARAG